MALLWKNETSNDVEVMTAFLRWSEESGIIRPSFNLLDSDAGDISVSGPFATYHVEYDKLGNTDYFRSLESDIRKYILFNEGSVIADIDLMDIDEKTIVSSIGDRTPLSRSIPQALSGIENERIGSNKDYEIRIISDLASHFHAVWLSGDNEDLIYPIEPTMVPKLSLYKIYHPSDLSFS